MEIPTIVQIAVQHQFQRVCPSLELDEKEIKAKAWNYSEIKKEERIKYKLLVS